MGSKVLDGREVLVVEDEALFRKRLVAWLERAGANVTAAGSVEEGRNLLDGLAFDFALVDIHLPDGVGLDLLREGAFQEATVVVIMTAEGGVETAVEAMKLGAADYLGKPFDFKELPLVLDRARKGRQDERLREHSEARGAQEEAFFFGPALASLRGQLDKILQADARLQGRPPPVLLVGETGTGKTTVARWLHRHGPRAGKAFVEVNCSALPEQLAESELFGHERGAFTDARSARIGLFEAADGGTLFLDEVPSLPPAIQAKLLVAVEDGTIRRVGGNRSLAVNVRLIAATNRDLPEMVAAGEFREDLFHRLDLLRVELPPLRDRGEDIVNLAEHLLDGLRKRYRLPQVKLSAQGKRRLLGYRWPGNVRELGHELERAIVLGETDELTFEHLGGATAVPSAEQDPADWLNARFVFPEEGFSLEAAIDRLIATALEQTGGNVSAAARLLGVKRDYLRYRLGEKKEG